MSHEGYAIRVFLVGGHQILLWGLQRLIESVSPSMQLVGSASDVTDALQALKSNPADLILLDLDLPVQNAANIPRLAKVSSARILALTRRDDQTVLDKAVLDGASGILDRHASAETFLEAISKVHEGQLWLDRAATGRIFVELSRRETAKHANPEQAKIKSLTEREKKVVVCIFENTGSPARALAEKLHISESTLRNHLTSIYGKLGISNRFELISFAIKHDLRGTLQKAETI